MRINLLIDKNGVYQNAIPELINIDNITGVASSTSYACQVTLEFYNSIIQNSNGIWVPNASSVVTTGLSGNVALNLFASKNSPIAVPLTNGNLIDVSKYNTMQWTGVVYKILFTNTAVTGCNYINVLFDKNNSGA